MTDENITTDNQADVTTEAPAQPITKVAPPESRFLFVDVAAMRAKQLRRGARPRIAGADGEPSAEAPRKPERIAMEEVRQGLVSFEVPGPEPAPSGEPE